MDRLETDATRKNIDPKSKIIVEDVFFEYETAGPPVVVLEDMDLEVERGEFLCLLGPSGCGKSTLLHIIAGLLDPTSGKVLVDGAEIEGMDHDRAVVFQRDAVFPWYTVEQNISYGPRMRGVPSEKIKRITSDLVKMVHLQGFEDRFPRELSGGMRKRVDVARSYANSPSLLLMDEPFAALDEFTKEAMQVDLQNLWLAQGGTIIFVTHDIEEAIFLADRIIVMSPRPSNIRQEFKVDFERPRNVILKTSSDFQALRKAVLECLGRDKGSVEL